MDERTARQALRAMSPRMPGADIDALVTPVAQAWNGHIAGGRLLATMAVIADATWRPGYTAGTAHGHRFVTDSFTQTARRTLADGADRLAPQAQRLLRAVAGTATAVSTTLSTTVDPGPSRYDYLTAMGDANGVTDADNAAIAARVGWMHGYHTGDADAAWSATARIVDTVYDLLDEDTVERLTLDGLTGDAWLARLGVSAREPSEHDVMYPRSSPAQAFAPLREVRVTSTVDTTDPTAGNAPPQRQGRRR